MTYFTTWEEFATACQRLYSHNPDKCRFVTKYASKKQKMVLKLTDDVVCLQVLHFLILISTTQYESDQIVDVKRMSELSANLMRAMVTK